MHKRNSEFEPEISSNLALYNDKTKLILLGDSILYKFGSSNLMPDLNPINLASASMHTENLLYRLNAINVMPMRKVPVVALMIGGFNIGTPKVSKFHTKVSQLIQKL
jgi:hypothetical protein